MTQLNTYPCRSMFTPKNLLLTVTTWRNLQYITKTLFRMRQSVDEAYLVYVRGRNQQVMRGLFHSDVMSNVPSYLRGILEGAVSGMLEGRPVSKTELFSSLAVAFKRFALGSLGRLLVSPVYIVTSLVNLVLTGGRVILRDFFYNNARCLVFSVVRYVLLMSFVSCVIAADEQMFQHASVSCRFVAGAVVCHASQLGVHGDLV